MEIRTVAVIGAGHLGKIHAKLLKTVAGVQPFVVEPDPAARQFVADELGLPVFESVEAIRQRLDGAIVVTPTATHFDVARHLIESGCHLLVEKPICADADSSRRLCELAEEHERLLQVGHVERFNPAFVAARPFLREVVHVECNRHTPYTFRATDVSVVQDLMIHDIDLLLSVIPSEVVHVSATGTRLIGPHWDTAVAWLEFANGTKARLSASRVSPAPERKLHAQLPHGWVDIDFAGQAVTVGQVVDNARARLDQLNGQQQQTAREEMFEKWLPMKSVEVTPQNAILEEQKEFVAALNGQGTPTVSGRDGLAAVEVAEQVLAALETGATADRRIQAA